MFYFLGSFLFAFAMMAAFAVMAENFARYRKAMLAALRSLSLDGFGDAPRLSLGFTPPVAGVLPALQTVVRRSAA